RREGADAVDGDHPLQAHDLLPRKDEREVRSPSDRRERHPGQDVTPHPSLDRARRQGQDRTARKGEHRADRAPGDRRSVRDRPYLPPRDNADVGFACCTRWTTLVREGPMRSKNGFGYTPISTIIANTGAITSFSRPSRSRRCLFSSLTTGPCHTRWYAHSRST